MSGSACPRCGRPVAGGKFCPACGAPLGDPLAGRVLGGRLTVGTAVRRSAFFTTYRVEAKSGGSPGVIKVLAPALAADDGKRRRFLENAGAAMSHVGAGLLAVREMADEAVPGPDGKPLRVAYALCDVAAGRSLEGVVAKEGALAPGRAVACVRGVLQALGPLHAAGGIHADLHPACVLLEAAAGGERVRLADAGLAAGLGPPRSEEPAALGSDGGRWIAPEQAAGQGATAASDLHAAGAILHFALTGHSPWQARQGPALLYEIQKSFPRPASEVRPGVPRALDAVIDRSLAKSPRDRFPDAASFLRALDEAGSALPAAPAMLVEEDPPAAVPADMTLEAPGDTGAPEEPASEATITGVLAAGEADATLAAPRAAAVEEDETPAPPRAAAPAAEADATMTAPRAAASDSGDATVLSPRSVTPPRPPALPPKARPAAPPARPAPSRASARPPASAPAPARPAPPKPAPADRTVPAKAPPATAASAAPAAAAPGAKARGPWSVGSPVGVFAILLGLGTGALYGAVWAGALDAQIPPWLRSITGRTEVPAVREASVLPPRTSFHLTLNVVLPRSIAFPLEGTGPREVFGRWRLVKDPPEGEPAAGGGGEEKVFARGELGAPDASGAIPVALSVPPGKYRLEGSLRYGEIAPKVVEVRDLPRTESLEVVPGEAVLVVKVLQQVGHVWLYRNLAPLQDKPIPKDVGRAAFGLPSDGPDRRLRFGDDVTVVVKEEGFKEASKRVQLRESPQLVEFDLEESPGSKVEIAIREIRKSRNLPPRYLDDPEVLRDPRVKVALATVDAGKGAWDRVEFYVDDLRSSFGAGTPLPEGAEELFATLHEHCRSLAAEAAEKGDTARVRALRAKSRPEILSGGRAEEERTRWAELEIRACLQFEKGVAGGPGGEDLAPLAALVDRDLKAASPENRERLQREVAEGILLRRAWAAWNLGTELRAPGAGAAPPVPGPDVAALLDLAVRAWPGVADTVPFQRLRARLEDLGAAPEKAARWLAGDPQWGPGKVIPAGRRDALNKKDRLLLARALARWGDLRRADGTDGEAMALWKVSWEMYQTVLDADAGPGSDFPEEMAAAACLEGARLALLVSGNETARLTLQRYLNLRPGDREAVRLRDEVLARAKPLEAPAKMQELKFEPPVLVPAGRFRVGTDTPRSPTDEEPFGDGTTVSVRVLPARDHDLAAFLCCVREVTKAQYDEYVRAMADPERAKLWRHPEEPPEKSKPGAREVKAGLQLSPNEPVRGVDWWDAWACARFCGGRLPTEAEWEKAARWNGREVAPEDPLRVLLAHIPLQQQWRAFWPAIGADLSPFDAAPSGARGFYGGVAEWTMDPFQEASPGAPGVKEGVVLSVAVVPPVLRAGDREVMAVRGGSFFHQPPGQDPGPSPAAEAAAPAAGGKEAPKEGAAPSKPTKWRAMDLLDRRGVPAGRAAKWVGFRIVVGSPASEKPR